MLHKEMIKVEKQTMRKSITLSLELAKWFEEKAKAMGVTQSGLMTVALNYYVESVDSEKNVISIDEFLNKMEQINKQTKS